MDAKEKPQVSVVCVLTDDPVQELRLSFTKGAAVTEAPPLTEAEAVLTDMSDGREAGRFRRDNDGVWRLDYAAIPRHEYMLEVWVPGYEKIYAQQAMPSLQVSGDAYFYLLHYVDPPAGWTSVGDEVASGDLRDYRWTDSEILPKGETFLRFYCIPNPVWIYAMNYNSAKDQREIAEEICTSNQESDDFNLTGALYNPPEKDEPIPYSARHYMNNPDYFFDPDGPSKLAGAHITKLYPLLEGSKMHDRYLRFSAGLEKQVVAISGSFYGKYNCKNIMKHFYYGDNGQVRNLAEDEGYLVCMAVSKDLDRYLKEAYTHIGLERSTDLSTIYLRDNLSSNIQGGIGIFGCKKERKYQWSDEYSYVDVDYERESYLDANRTWPVDETYAETP